MSKSSMSGNDSPDGRLPNRGSRTGMPGHGSTKGLTTTGTGSSADDTKFGTRQVSEESKRRASEGAGVDLQHREKNVESKSAHIEDIRTPAERDEQEKKASFKNPSSKKKGTGSK